MVKFKKSIILTFITLFLIKGLVWASNLSSNNYSPDNYLFFLRYLINLGIKNGLNEKNILYLLLLPLIALIIVFFKQVIGIKTLGIYIPSILTIVFLDTGFFYGFILFLFIFILGSLFRWLFKKSRLLYTPKVAILLTLISLIVLIFLSLAATYNLNQFVSISILIIFILIVLIEEFIDIQVKKSIKESIYLFLGTILVSILSYLFVSLSIVRNFFLNYPEIIFLILILDYLLGKWSGLRVIEYYRFRKGLKNVSLTQK